MSEKAKPLPWSKEGEIIVLATAMIDGPKFMPKALEAGLAVEDFYDTVHQVIWGAILELATAGDPTEEVAVIERLRNMPAEKPNWDNRLSELGGLSVVIEITNQVESTSTAPYYLGVVKSKSLHRQAIVQAKKLTEAATAPAQDFEEVALRITPALSELSRLGTIEREQSLAEVIAGLEDLTERKLKGEAEVKDPAALVYWPAWHLNDAFSPLDPNEMDFLTGIFGEPSHGKSAFAQQMSYYNIVERKRRGLLFLLESTRERIVSQMCAQQAGINLRDSLRGQYGDREEWKFPWAGQRGEDRVKRYRECMKELKEAEAEGRLHMRERGATISQICQTARLIAQQYGRLNFILVDYLQLIRKEPHEEKYRSDEVLGDHAYALADLGKSLNCPVLLICNTNRSGGDENSGPTLKSLRGSGAIEFALIRALAIHRPAKLPSQDADGKPILIEQTEDRQVFQVMANMLKDKGGARGLKWLQFHKTSTRFYGPPPPAYRGRGHKKEETA